MEELSGLETHVLVGQGLVCGWPQVLLVQAELLTAVAVFPETDSSGRRDEHGDAHGPHIGLLHLFKGRGHRTLHRDPQDVVGKKGDGAIRPSDGEVIVLLGVVGGYSHVDELDPPPVPGPRGTVGARRALVDHDVLAGSVRPSHAHSRACECE